jgi:hypothetical protein
MTTFPTTIEFTSDKNIAELVELLPKENSARYRYVVSNTKKGKTFITNLDYLKRLLDSRLLEIEK